jgi:antitoxin component YwqK of YwqJK toxin-antitoxin module
VAFFGYTILIILNMIACKRVVYAILFIFFIRCGEKKILSHRDIEPPFPEYLTNSNNLYFADTSNRLPQNGTYAAMHEGKSLFLTNIRNGKLNGVWQSWYSTGSLCDSGSFQNNLPTGIWKFWNDKGVLVAIRQYNAEKYYRISDEMLRFNPRRSFYYLSQLYQQNRPAALHYLSGSYSFPAANNKGQQRLFIKQIVQSNINTGSLYTPVFYNCLHEGLYMNFFSNGLVKDSGYYRDGLKTGKWIHHQSATGPSYQGRYQHGIRIKDWKVYNASHRLIALIHYNHNGHIQWQKEMNK